MSNITDMLISVPIPISDINIGVSILRTGIYVVKWVQHSEVITPL